MNSREQFKKDDAQDLKWIQRAKTGNRKAFEKLVLKYQKRIYYLVRKMVMDHDDTNDIVQDTFVKAYINVDKFDESFAFYPWLHRIAINTTLNHQGKAFRQKEKSSLMIETDSYETQSEEGNPLREFLQDEFKTHVNRAMNTLPMDQRMIFILRTSEDLSYQEISERLNLSIGTVMSRLSRARQKLKTLLEPYLNAWI